MPGGSCGEVRVDTCHVYWVARSKFESRESTLSRVSPCCVLACCAHLLLRVVFDQFDYLYATEVSIF